MWKTIAATLVASAVLAAPASAQSERFADWDSNNNGSLEQDEFSAGLDIHGTFGKWDTDGDNSLSADEFARGMYGAYDVNGDQSIDEDEFGNMGFSLDRF